MTIQAQKIVALNKHSLHAANPCAACMKKSGCPVSGFTDNASASASFISARTFRTGELVFKAGDKFEGIYVVRSGFFKSSFIDASGEMQVTGFHFPGDVFGIDGIGGGQYGDSVAALDTGSVCKIPFSVFTDSRSGNDPRAQERMLSLVRMMSSTISRDRNMIFNLGKMDARRRFAVFLLDIADRMGNSGYNSGDFSLCMSRTDISNYLCLAIETVSRLFSQFHGQGIIHVERRQVSILDRDMLEALARDNLANDDRMMSKAG